MQKLRLLTFSIFLSLATFGQKNVIGLFGKCDQNYSGFMCQQALFNSDSTFQFYDLLHLRGWTITLGKWYCKGDTVVLNSPSPYDIRYVGNSKSDSVVIQFEGRDKKDFIAFASVTSNTDTFTTDIDGIIRLPKYLIDTIGVLSIGCFSCTIPLEKEKLALAEKIIISLSCDQSISYFENEKWLLKNDKLYHTLLSNGRYDKKKYFERTEINNLKYKQ